MQRPSRRTLITALAATSALPLAFAAAPANAACVPNGAGVPNGATVTCTGTDTTGVGNGTQTNVTVNVQSGAAITLGDNATDINLASSNVVNNAGALSAGNAAGAGTGVTGINGSTGNSFTSSGSITLGSALGVGSGVTGIFATNGNTITSSGTMTLGNAVGTGSGVDGIFAFNNNTLTNSGSMTLGSALGTGSGVDGIFGSNNSNVTNTGSLTIGSASGMGSGISGLEANSSSTVTNLGSLTIGSASGTNSGIFGLDANGLSNVRNGGTVTIGDASGANSGIFGANANSFSTVSNSGSFTIGSASGANSGIFGLNANDHSNVGNTGNLTIGSASGLNSGIFGLNANSFSNVSNGGSFTIGSASGANSGIFGLNANDHSGVFNTGSLTIGSASGMNSSIFGLNANSFSNIVNTGSLVIGSASGPLSSIFAINANDHSTVANSGSMTLGSATGANSVIFGVNGNNNSAITNNGSMTLGSASGANSGIIGIFAGSNSTATNNGSMTLGNGSAAGSGAVGIIAVSGDTVVNNGTMTLGNGSASGTAVGIQFNGMNNTFTNAGTVRVGAGPGTTFTILTNNGNNTFTNTSTGVLDGEININGAGNAFTNAGLIEITNPGTPLAVGNFFITGNYTQTATGTLALRVNPAGGADTLQVMGGAANIGGTVGAVLQPGLYGNSTTYTGVVTATTVNGQFAKALAFATGTTIPLVFFSVTPIYHPASVDLSLNRIGFGSVAGETLNEQRVGNSLNAAFSTSLTGVQALFFSNLLQATSVQALDNLSGEGTSGTQNTAFSAGDAFLGSMQQQADAWRNGGSAGWSGGGTTLNYVAQPNPRKSPFDSLAAFKALPPPAFVPTWRGWLSGFGGSQSLNGDPVVGSARLSDRFAGGAMGFDYSGAPDWLVGISGGASSSRFSVNDRLTNGSLEGGHVGVYGAKTFGSFYVQGLAAYAHFDNSTNRLILGVGPTESAIGSFGSDQFGGRLEIGNSWRFGWLDVTPFAAIQAVELRQSGYTESSVNAFGAPGILALTYAPMDVTSVPSFLGVQFDARVPFANGWVWSPYVRAAWEHEFHTSRQVTPALTILPGAAWTVDGAPAARDSARIDAGSRLEINKTFALVGAFNGLFSGRGNLYAGTGGLRISW